jgi:hypothetical protein
MTPEETASFLDQYVPKQPTAELAPVQPGVEQTTVSPQTTTAPQDNISNFLDQYEQPQTPRPADVPAELTPAEKFMSPSQQELMTHKTKPIGPNFWEVRPEVITEGVKKGFSDMAALPGYAVDIVNWPLHKMGITPETAVGGSDMIRKGWQLLTGYQAQTPQTTAERYAGRVAEFAGATLMPGAGFYAKAAGRGTLPAANETLKLREAYNIIGTGAQMPRLAAPATAEELKWVIGAEAASAVTGGIGSEYGGAVGEQIAGQPGRVLGEMIGGISGGMPPLYFKTVGATIFNSFQTAKSVMNKSAMDSIMENTAKKQISKMVGEDAAATKNLERSIALQKEIPGFNPNLAAATGSKGLSAQQEILDQTSIENYNNALSHIDKANNAIDHYFDKTFKLSGKELTAPIIYRHVRQALKTEVKTLGKQAEDVTGLFPPKPTAEIGGRLKELRAIKKQQIMGIKNKLYDDLQKRADDLGIVDDASDLYQLAQNFIKQDATVFQKIPGVYKKMADIFGRDIDPELPLGDQKIMTSFSKLNSLARETSNAYGKALKSGDAPAEYYLGQVKELINQKLAQFDDPIYGNFANYKHAVDKYWLEEYHNVFRKGVGGRMVSDTKWGQRTPDEKIVSSLVMQKGTSKGLDEFNKLYENVPEAQGLLRDGILDMFSSEIRKKMAVSSKDVNNFLVDYKQVFDKMPDLRNTFMDTDALTTAITNRQAKIIKIGKKFTNDKISPYAKVAGFKTADAAVEAGLKDPSVMRVLVRNAKSQAERQDITTIIANHVLGQSNPWQFLLDNEKQLANHFNQLGSKHFNNLKNIAEAQNIMGRYALKEPGQATVRGIKDVFFEKTGTTFASAVSQLRWAFFYHKTGVYYPAADIGSKYFYKMREGQIGKLMERSLYDPDLAKTMSELTQLKSVDVQKMGTMKLLSDLGLHAMNNGIRVSAVTLSDQQTGLGMDLPQ